MKYFIFKKLNQVKSDSRMEYKYVRKKKIFTCLMNEKKKINEIKITSTNSHRVDIHFIEKSDFLRLMNESQRIEK